MVAVKDVGVEISQKVKERNCRGTLPARPRGSERGRAHRFGNGHADRAGGTGGVTSQHQTLQGGSLRDNEKWLARMQCLKTSFFFPDCALIEKFSFIIHFFYKTKWPLLFPLSFLIPLPELLNRSFKALCLSLY